MKQFLFGNNFTGNKIFNIAWLLFRFYIGFTIAIGAGWPKMNELTAPGWFVKQVSELGFTFPSPAFWAAAAAWGEFVGGLCIAFGFFTRFSAIQLAIQFFVISFIWYNEPAPIVGMYYQQLLFWGFVLIAASGAGKYSIDNWIMNRKVPPLNMKKFGTSISAIAMIILFSSFSNLNQLTLHPSELNYLDGKWKGVLTYKDYTSGYSAKVDVIIYGSRKGDENKSRTWVLKYEYPKEPKANSMEKYVISKEGTMINDGLIIEKQTLPDAKLRIITEKRGKDGNEQKPCTFRQIIELGASTLTITKMVKFDDESEFFQRNQIILTK